MGAECEAAWHLLTPSARSGFLVGSAQAPAAGARPLSASWQPLPVTSSAGRAGPLVKRDGGREPLGQGELERDVHAGFRRAPSAQPVPAACRNMAQRAAPLAPAQLWGRPETTSVLSQLAAGERLRGLWKGLPAPRASPRLRAFLWFLEVLNVTRCNGGRSAVPSRHVRGLSEQRRPPRQPPLRVSPTWLPFLRDGASHDSRRPCPRRRVLTFN